MRFIFIVALVIGSFTVLRTALAQDQSQYYQQQQYLQNQQQTSTPPAETQSEPAPVSQPAASEPLPQAVPTEKQNVAPETSLAPTTVAAPAPTVAQDAVPALLSQEAAGLNVDGALEATPVGFYIFYAAIGAGILFFVGAWWQRWRKHKKTESLPAEDDGTVCPTCKGSGKIKKKRTQWAPCGHCKEKGRETCHYCSGSGKNGAGLVVPQTEEDVQNFMDCDYCKGTGLVSPALPCCMCKGKRKISYEESYEEACPTCKGSGLISK